MSIQIVNGKTEDNKPKFKSSVMSSEDTTEKNIQKLIQVESIIQKKELRSNNNGEKGSARDITVL